MATTTESTLNTPLPPALYTKTWNPPTTTLARLVFLHGFSDHINAYYNLFPTLAAAGIKVHAFDQRGWGRSVQEPKQRGLSGPGKQVLEDITTFIQSLPEEEGVPMFLMGHSMGGGETIEWAANGPREVVGRIRGFLLEAPLIEMVTKPFKATVLLGKLAAKVMPAAPMVQKLDASLMSRDPQVCSDWAADPLCHDTGTLEGLAGILDRTAGINSGTTVLREGRGEGGKTRIWVSHGTGDKITDFGATKKWYDSLDVKDKELRAYDGWYHKLHAEPGEDRETFAKDVQKWILDRAGALEEGGDVKSKL